MPASLSYTSSTTGARSSQRVLTRGPLQQRAAAAPGPWRRSARFPARAIQQQQAASAQQQQAAGGAVDSMRQEATKRRVVLAVDASEDSIAAYNWVLRNLMRKEQDELHLLHVVPDVFTSPASGSIYYACSPDPETERMLWKQIKEFFMDNFLQHAKDSGMEDDVTLHLVKESRTHHIGKAVCKKADELGAEPLVVAAHDRSLLERALLGSVSQYCVAHSKRPVLLLHPNHSQL